MNNQPPQQRNNNPPRGVTYGPARRLGGMAKLLNQNKRLVYYDTSPTKQRPTHETNSTTNSDNSAHDEEEVDFPSPSSSELRALEEIQAYQQNNPSSRQNIEKLTG